jgi:hypothetical protein
MADHLTISLTGPLADDVRAAAAAHRVSPEEYVRLQLTLGVTPDTGEDLSWEEDERRLAEPGENIPLDEAMDMLRAKVEERRTRK